MTPYDYCAAITVLLDSVGLPSPDIGEKWEHALPKLYDAVRTLTQHYTPADLSRRYWERS